MARTKQQLIRIGIIDRLISRSIRTSLRTEDIREVVENEMFGTNKENVSRSTIEKDIFLMKMEMDAPISYDKRIGYYYTDKDYNAAEAFMNTYFSHRKPPKNKRHLLQKRM